MNDKIGIGDAVIFKMSCNWHEGVVVDVAEHAFKIKYRGLFTFHERWFEHTHYFSIQRRMSIENPDYKPTVA